MTFEYFLAPLDAPYAFKKGVKKGIGEVKKKTQKK